MSLHYFSSSSSTSNPLSPQTPSLHIATLKQSTSCLTSSLVFNNFKKFEPLDNYDVCDHNVDQYQNMTTVLTREYLDAHPGGWVDYAPLRIAQLGTRRCMNKPLCEENLNILLPTKPPFHPRQFRTCAVVVNSRDLLKIEFRDKLIVMMLFFETIRPLLMRNMQNMLILRRIFF
ncbi:Sialyltransferase-like protein 5, partial [Mucuna pruriens]